MIITLLLDEYIDMIIHFDIFIKKQSEEHKILSSGNTNILHSEYQVVGPSNAWYITRLD